MDSLTLIRALVEHNYWARDRQLAACAGLSEAQFLQPSGGSFPSLRDTLVHLAAVERIWLDRWLGVSASRLLTTEELPTLVAIEASWRQTEVELRAFVAGLDEAKLAGPLTYTKMRGGTFTYPLHQLVLHVMQHQAYHRGQVTMQLRALGIPPPAVDYLVAVDEGLAGL